MRISVLAAAMTACLAVGASAQIPVYTKANPPATPKLEELKLADSVTKDSITWFFEKPARVGRFVNGDWYVVGPVTVKMIDPKPLWGEEVGELINRSSVKEDDYPGKQARNGSTLNPPARDMRVGFDSRVPSGRYNPDYFTHLPIQMKPGDSLVSTISRRNDEIRSFSGQHVDPLRIAAVLSCVEKPLPPDAFRPSYCDSANSPLFLSRNLRRDMLLNLPKVEGMPPNLDQYAFGRQGFGKVWLDIAQFGFAAPTENLPHYGQQFVDKVGEASLLLLCDYPPEVKEPLVVGMVQAGIDFWGLVRAGRMWAAHGGLNSGRKWLIIFAGLLLGDEDMMSPNKKYPNCRFHEDDQTAFCPYEYRGKVHQTGWTGAKAIFTGHSLPGSGGTGNWERGWGCVDVYHPSEWPKLEPGSITASEGYRRANTSASWVGQALACRMLHAEKYWNHDAFFAYVDRWMTEDDTPFIQEIAKARGVTFKPNLGDFFRQQHVYSAAFVKTMWLKYRNNLPPAPDGHKDPPAEETWK